MNPFLKAYLFSRPNATDAQLADYLFYHHFTIYKSLDAARKEVEHYRSLSI